MLDVNASKTKVVIFSRGKVRNFRDFVFNGEVLEVVDEFTYLGVVFNYKNNFKKAQNKQVSQAKKAMYSLMIKSKKLRLPIDIQLDLFNRLVVPILLYGSEVWGYENLTQIEGLHNQYCKQLLRLRKNTMNHMALGELGRLELSRLVKERMINYWYRSITGKEIKLSTIVCNILKLLNDQDIYSSPWIKFIHTTLNELGMSNIWDDYGQLNKLWLKSAIKLRLNDTYFQKWQNKINDSTVCLNYRIIKNDIKLERYLIKLPFSLRLSLTRFRCANHRLPIVTGRYAGIERDNRVCNFCDTNKIGDEFHYLFECPKLKADRLKFIKPYYRIRPNALKMMQLFNSENSKELINLAKFCRKIMSLHVHV